MVLLVVVASEMVAGVDVGRCTVALQLLLFVAASSPEIAFVYVVELLEMRGRCVVAGVDGCWRRERDAHVWF